MSEIKNYRLTVHYEKDHIWAEVDDLPGCFASGRDMAELRDALVEAISLYLTDAQGQTTVASLEIEEVNPAATRMPARVELVPA